MLKLVSEIHTRQGAVIFSHAFRAQLYLRPTRYRFPPRLLIGKGDLWLILLRGKVGLWGL